MPKRTPPTLEQVIGRNLRRLGFTQDEIARQAQGVGLAWSRSTVAALEAGTKTLDAGELLLLALGVASLPDLMAGAGPVRYRGLTLELERARRAFAGAPPDLSTEDVGYLLHGLERMGADVREARARLGRPPAGEAEQKAARRLGVTVDDIVRTAQRKWGRSLSAERDARVADSAPADISPRSRQALRGQVTRQLLAELAPALTKSDRTGG